MVKNFLLKDQNLMSKFAMNLVEKFKLDLVLKFTPLFTLKNLASRTSRNLTGNFLNNRNFSWKFKYGTSVEVSGETLVETSHMYNVH